MHILRFAPSSPPLRQQQRPPSRGSDIHFNITIENCTFINFSTRSSGRLLFEFRFMPNDSRIAFKNNLIVLAADPNDKRDLNQSACDFRNVAGEGLVTRDISGNYSLGSRDAHMKDDGIFTSAAFSAKKNSVGDKWNWTPGLVSGNANDLIVKTGSTPLRADEFFRTRTRSTPPSTRPNLIRKTTLLLTISLRHSKSAALIPRCRLQKSIRTASATPLVLIPLTRSEKIPLIASFPTPQKAGKLFDSTGGLISLV